MALGLSVAIFGPVMLDLRYLLNVSIEMISLCMTFTFIGYMMGTLSGLLYNYLNRQLTISILFILTGLSSAAIPVSPNLYIVYLCFWMCGVSGGVWNSTINVWIIEMWTNRSASVLQFIQFGYGFGTILSPLILRPFLRGGQGGHGGGGGVGLVVNETMNVTNFTVYSNLTDITDNSDNDRVGNLWKPFVIIGCIQLISPIALLIMFLVKRYESPLTVATKSHNKSDRPIDSSTVSCNTTTTTTTTDVKLFDLEAAPRRLAILLLSLLLAAYTLIEFTLFDFGATYLQYTQAGITAPVAAQIMSTVSLAYTIGRAASVLVSLKLMPQYMIVGHISLLYLSLGVIQMYGQYSQPVLWTAFVCLGYGLSALFPAMFAYFEQYIQITNPMGTSAALMCGLANLFNPYILGLLIERHSYVVILFEVFYVTLYYDIQGYCLEMFVKYLDLYRPDSPDSWPHL
ncbi:sodium-dependent glucose transporter 1A-like [Oppia nitens]|uniref:sodium-dependent glucose transporter 1A-like n=1 Tax=Oppia nitens TaxID=1686743 RepID=UPI0023DB3AFF|nr:sodium-dependent glucose transporter 1A-like [Oppia nitens]